MHRPFFSNNVLLLIVTLWISGTTIASATDSDNVTLSYDKESDLISIRAQNVLMSRVLDKVHQATGVTYSIPPSIDNRIYLNIIRKPLDKALLRITRGLNSALKYRKKTTGQSIRSQVVELKILPVGEENTELLTSKPAIQMATPTTTSTTYPQSRAEHMERAQRETKAQIKRDPETGRIIPPKLENGKQYRFGRMQ